VSDLTVPVVTARRPFPLWIPLGAVGAILLAFLMPAGLQIAALATLGGAAFVIAMWRWPGVTVAMLPVFLVPPEFAKVFAYEVLLLLAFAGLIVIGVRRRAAWLTRLDPIEVAVWVLLWWATFTYFWCRDWWWWLFGVRKMLLGAIALWVGYRMTRFVDPDLLLLGVPVGSCALSLATIARTMSAGGVAMIATHHMRTESTDLGWGAANYLAAVLSLMLPTGVHLAMNGKKLLHRVIGWASLPCTAVVVTIAASRGGAVLVVAIALFAIFRSRIKPWMAVLSAVLLITLLVTGPGAKLLIGRFTDVEELASMVVRLWYFRVAWARLVDHWPLGMGLGQGYGYMDRLFTTDPHNYWLVLGSELGAVGLVLWITVLVMLWMRTMRLEKSPATHAEARVMQLTFGIAMANLMFEPTFQGLQYHALFYWIMGIYLGRPQATAARKAPPSPR